MRRLFTSIRALTYLAMLATATLSAAADPPDQRVEAFRKRPLLEKLATPRNTLETICFGADSYDKHTEMVHDMIACLDIDAKDGYQSDAIELLAMQMNEILDELSLPFIGIAGGGDGKPVTFYEDSRIKLVLVRCQDGLWRFDKDTVARIPVMRNEMAVRAKQRHAAGAALRQGLEDPTATMTTLLGHAVNGDWESAAARLDLSHLPVNERAAKGPLLAWKLACVLQRRGYIYRQAVPIDPEGPPFTWSVNSAGRIMVERVRQPGGKDTWLFARPTVEAIDAMWEREKVKQPDPRYLFLKTAVPLPPEGISEVLNFSGQAPDSVPRDLSSPRSMLTAFFKVMDDAEYDDARLSEARQFLDLSHLTAEEVNTAGSRRATMLEVVLRKIKPDPSLLSNRWSAPPQVLTGPGNLRVEIVRGTDGRWRFSDETVARLPAMYDSISGKEKAEGERTSGLSNPRETVVTFLRAGKRRDGKAAGRCLDLSDLPATARDNLAPVLAFKLRTILDRTGRVYLQAISNEPDGPQVVLYRGPLGRITLARREDDTSKSWRFTAATVSQIDEMFARSLELPVEPGTAAAEAGHLEPQFRHEPGIWMVTRLPQSMRNPVLGLRIYEWLGLVVLVLIATLAAYLVARLVFPVLVWFFHIGSAQADLELIRHRLGALRFVTFLLVVYYLLEWIDLPHRLAGTIYSLETFMMTAALVWAGFQWTDLGYLFYERSGHLDAHRGLGDLIAPFTRRMVKLGVIVAALTYLVYQFGQGDSLRQFLTGLGVAGLAVSLAAQDSLKNIFATLLLVSDRTFRVGDRLKIGDKEGVVEQMGFRSTKLRTPEDSLLVLPNSQLAYGVIDNLGARVHRRLRTLFSVQASTPLDRLAALQEGLREYLKGHPKVDHGRIFVYVERITDGSVELEVNTYIAARDGDTEKRCREELMCEILKLAHSLEVELSPGKVRIVSA